MFCTRCGKDIKEGNRFCEGCGALAPQGEGRSASPAAATRPLASVGDSSTMPLPVMAGMSDDRNPSSTASKAFCTGCGASLQEGTAFCTRCGKAVSGADAPLPQRSRDGASKAESSKKSSSNKGLIIGLVAAGVVLLVAAGVVLYLLFGQSAQSIEPVAADAPAASVETPQKASNAAEEDAATYDELESGEEPPATRGSAEPETSIDEATAPEPAPAPVEEPTASEYMLPDSDTRAYTTSELSALSDWELFVARNEIFARHGRGFQNPELAQYFGEKSWYTQRYSPEEFDAMSSPLSAVEKQNTETMLALEQSRGSQYL